MLDARAPSTGGVPYIDETTAFCYKLAMATRLPFSNASMLDRTYQPGVLHRIVERPDTTHWYKGDRSICRDDKPTPDARRACTEEPCVRGYDLLQWPQTATCESPRLLFIHGGSWKFQSPWDASYDVHTSKIAGLAGIVVLSIDYPLIGAHDWKSDAEVGNFRGAMSYAFKAWRWLADHGPDAESCSGQVPMFVAGDSSGGGTAFSFLLSLRHREEEAALEGLRMPAGALFESPWTNLKCDSPTYYTNNFAAWPTIEEASKHPESGVLTGDFWFYPLNMRQNNNDGNVGSPWNLTLQYAKNGLNYCGCATPGDLPSTCPSGTCGANMSTEAQLTHWLASPFWAESHHLVGLPPLYFATSSTESLAADTTVLAQRAASVGVSVTIDLFAGMWHTFAFWSEGCGSNKPLWQGKAALRHMGEFVVQVSEAWRRCPSSLRRWSNSGVPVESRNVVQTMYDVGLRATRPLPWTPVLPLKVELC